MTSQMTTKSVDAALSEVARRGMLRVSFDVVKATALDVCMAIGSPKFVTSPSYVAPTKKMYFFLSSGWCITTLYLSQGRKHCWKRSGELAGAFRTWKTSNLKIDSTTSYLICSPCKPDTLTALQLWRLDSKKSDA
jgi:hypothetical protein